MVFVMPKEKHMVEARVRFPCDDTSVQQLEKDLMRGISIQAIRFFGQANDPCLIFLVSIAAILIIGLSGCAHDFSVGYALHAKQLLEEENDPEGAIESAKQSTLFEPSYAPGWYWLGVAYFRKGGYQEAIPAFQKVFSLTSSGAQYESSYHFLGLAQSQLGIHTEAISNLSKSHALEPESPALLYDRGVAYYRADRYDKAINDYNQALALNPDLHQALYSRGQAYFELEDPDRALTDFKSYLVKSPQDSDALEYAGRCYYLKGMFAEAIRYLGAAIKQLETEQTPVTQDIPSEVAAFFGGDTGVVRVEGTTVALHNALRYKAFAYLGLGDAETSLALLHRANETLAYDLNSDLMLYYFVLGDMSKVWKYRGGRGMLGIQIQPVPQEEPTGVLVVAVTAASPAAKAGLLGGDIVVKLGQTAIPDVATFITEARALIPGKQVKLTILREGIEREILLLPISGEALLKSEKIIAPILARKKTEITRQDTIVSTALPGSQPTQPIRSSSQYWAVVIGISSYADSRIPGLRYADRDAESFYQWLTSPEGGRLPPANIQLLLNRQATVSSIKKALFVWLSQALSEDVIIIYFAGHGSPDSPDSPNNLFLLPYDTRYDDIATSAFPMWDIETALQRFIKSDRVIVIADACHSGGVGTPYQLARRSGRDITVNQISSGLSNLSQAGTGICVISASDENQFSRESRSWGGGHGVFTFYLLKGLEGEADYDKNGKVSLGEIIPYLSENVRRATRNGQSPTVSGKFDPALHIGL